MIVATYIDHMGSDLSVVNDARVSFSKKSDWEYPRETVTDDYGLTYDLSLGPHLSESDAKLIRYLAKHDHWTPYAHSYIKLRIQAPIPIRTQCFKHKQGFVENEESRRYINTTPVLFLPDTFRAKPEGSIKQGSGDVHPKSDHWLGQYERVCLEAIKLYETMIADGVCPEQARFVLPQGCEVQWIWTGSLYAYANFFNKRTDPHAQKEIQDLAHMVGDIIKPLFPVSWVALTGESYD
jgi:thymidylate synthase (FAD)